MNKNNNAVEAKKIFAKFSESIFFSIKNIENKMQNVQKNNFFFSFCDSQKINICNENDAINNPRIYIQGLDKLFDMSATSGNDNPMVGFAKALISSDSDWEIEYIAETKDYGNNCLKISKNNIPSENINGTDTQPEQDLNITIQLIEPYLFDAIFTDYEAINVTVHFVDFDDNDKDIEQDYIITAKEVAFVDEIKLYDANGNEANAIPHGETASLQWANGNIYKCKVSLHNELGEVITFKDVPSKKRDIIQEADLPAIDRDRVFTLNLEKDDRITSLKIPVFEAPYFDEISVFDSEGYKVATALDSKGQKFHVIHKGDEATIKWHGGNSEKCNSTLYKKDENGQEKEISPDNVKINKDTTFKLVLERNGCETSTEFTIRCTGWKKEGVCKNLPFYSKGIGNNHFFYNTGKFVDNISIGYYMYTYSKLFFSQDLIEWIPFKNRNFGGSLLGSSSNTNHTNATFSFPQRQLCLAINECFSTPVNEMMCYASLFRISNDVHETNATFHIERQIKKNEILFSQMLRSSNDTIWWIAVCKKQIHLFTMIEDLFSKPSYKIVHIAGPHIAGPACNENVNIIYNDITYNNNKISFACLCDNNSVYIFEFDTNTNEMSGVKSSFKLEGKQQTRISWVTTDSLYLVLDNYIIKLDENYQATKDNCIYTYISPMDSMKDKHQGMVLFGPKEENGKLIIAAIVQDDKETNLWTYIDGKVTPT